MLGHTAQRICLGSCLSLRAYWEGAKLILFISFPAVLRVENNSTEGFSSLQAVYQREDCFPTESVPVFAPVHPCRLKQDRQPGQGRASLITSILLTNPTRAPPPTPDPAPQSYIWFGIWNSETLLAPGKISGIQVMSKSEGWLFLLVCPIICSKVY